MPDAFRAIPCDSLVDLVGPGLVVLVVHRRGGIWGKLCQSKQSEEVNSRLMRMLRAVAPLMCVMLAAVGGFTPSADAESRSRIGKKDSSLKIAFTFDDLPAHSALPPNTTRAEIAQKIVTALRNEHMPPVYGMVNGALIEKKPEDAVVLQIWHDAGNPLGNHTWSHPHLSQDSPEAFELEISRNEAAISSVMTKGDWHWFRYPFLDEGETPEKRAEVRKYLADHGYKVAAVTMSFGDYMWNEPYARCVARNDQDGIATLKSSYLAAADESITRYREMSQKLYGRDIPYVLLMHIGSLDAEMLPQLLQLYRKRGFKFMSLREAESDEVYRADIHPDQPLRAGSLEGAMKEKGLPSPKRTVALPPFESMCR